MKRLVLVMKRVVLIILMISTSCFFAACANQSLESEARSDGAESGDNAESGDDAESSDSTERRLATVDIETGIVYPPCCIEYLGKENIYAASLEELGDLWARAYCNRDGHILYSLCYDKKLFIDIHGDIVEGSGHKRIGMSSPWPWYEEEAKVIVDGDTVSYILYWRTSDHISSGRENLLYTQTEYGYQVTGIDYPDSTAASKAAFDYSYILGLPPFYQYTRAYQSAADRDPETWGNYYNPVISGFELLRIENAEASDYVVSNYTAKITFTWADGAVTIVMAQLGVKGENGVWVPVRILE